MELQQERQQKSKALSNQQQLQHPQQQYSRKRMPSITIEQTMDAQQRNRKVLYQRSRVIKIEQGDSWEDKLDATEKNEGTLLTAKDAPIPLVPPQVTSQWALYLTDLEINNCRLQALPNNIGNLTQLEKLSVIHNELCTIPASLERCKKLRVLRLFNNEIESIPEEIGNIKELRLLNLDNNKLKFLPNSLCGLLNLRGYNLRLFGNPDLDFRIEDRSFLSLLRASVPPRAETILQSLFHTMYWTPRHHSVFAKVCHSCSEWFLVVLLSGNRSKFPSMPVELWWEIFRNLSGDDFVLLDSLLLCKPWK
eukprot:m.346080 g.346080  ORF g.346080 m.346080 type:complete len:307 (-) comp28100_c0_seq1:97-1017(-)